MSLPPPRRDDDRPPVSLWPILAVNFVGTLGFSIVLPFLVFLVTRWGGNALIYGLAGATYSLFQLVGAPILGRWSDTRGRKRILLLSQLGTLVSWLVLLGALFLPAITLAEVDSPALGRFALTLPLALLFFARAADGLTGGNISVANAYLADITSDADRNRNFGRMAASANLGFIVGPALAGLLGATPWGETPPVLAALVISLLASVMILFGLPESKSRPLASDPEKLSLHKMMSPDQKDCFEMTGAAKTGLRGIVSIPCVAPLLGIHFLIMLAFNFFYAAFPVHASGSLGWSVAGMGVFFAFLSALMVLVQGPVLSWASAWWRDRTLIVAGGLALVACFTCFTGASDGVIYAGGALMALGNGLMWPSLLSILSKAAGPDRQGAVQGFAGSSGAVASIAGLLAGGFLYGRIGAGVFVASAAGILAASLLALTIVPPREDAAR